MSVTKSRRKKSSPRKTSSRKYIEPGLVFDSDSKLLLKIVFARAIDLLDQDDICCPSHVGAVCAHLRDISSFASMEEQGFQDGFLGDRLHPNLCEKLQKNDEFEIPWEQICEPHLGGMGLQKQFTEGKAEVAS
jgi:hypothetical protein